MKALIHHDPGKIWNEKPEASVPEATSAIVRTYKTTVCGIDFSDLRRCSAR
jgi:threonine dehydrogenase-like Zn-dependent dehydrogenase